MLCYNFGMDKGMPRKALKWIVLVENAIILVAFCFIIVGSALGLASHGSEGENYVGEILFIVMAGLGPLVPRGSTMTTWNPAPLAAEQGA